MSNIYTETGVDGFHNIITRYNSEMIDSQIALNNSYQVDETKNLYHLSKNRIYLMYWFAVLESKNYNYALVEFDIRNLSAFCRVEIGEKPKVVWGKNRLASLNTLLKKCLKVYCGNVDYEKLFDLISESHSFFICGKEKTEQLVTSADYDDDLPF